MIEKVKNVLAQMSKIRINVKSFQPFFINSLPPINEDNSSSFNPHVDHLEDATREHKAKDLGDKSSTRVTSDIEVDVVLELNQTRHKIKESF